MFKKIGLILLLIYSCFLVKPIHKKSLRRIKNNIPFLTEIQILNSSTSKLDIANTIHKLIDVAISPTEEEEIRKRALLLATGATIRLLESEENGNGQKLERVAPDEVEYFTDQISNIISLRNLDDKKNEIEVITPFFYKLLYIIRNKSLKQLQINSNMITFLEEQLYAEMRKLLVKELNISEVIEFINSIEEFHKTRAYNKQFLEWVASTIEKRHPIPESLRMKLNELQNINN